MMKKKISIWLFCLTFVISVGLGVFPFFTQVKADAGFAMVNGASVRLDEDGGIRFIAGLGSEYVEGSNDKYYMLIVPDSYVTTYAPEGGDYYKLITEGLKTSGKNEFVANMETFPVVLGKNDLGLSETEYYVRGSLTNIKFDNVNTGFFGVAYKESETGERVYASFNEGENVRDMFYVASAALNDEQAEYTEADKGVLNKYILNGFKKAEGKTENEAYEINLSVEPKNISALPGDTTKISLTGVPNGVNLSVKYSSSAEEVVSVGQDGTVTCKNSGTADITVRVLGKDYIIPVTVKNVQKAVLTVEDKVVATNKTYAGNVNENNNQTVITSSIEGVTYSVSDPAVAEITQDGVLRGGSKRGTVTVYAEKTDADGDVVVSGETTLEVYTAVNSKFDFDMLALAYARGVNESDWGKDSKYILTSDVDYGGEAWIPIAAIFATNHTAYTSILSPVWKNMFVEGNKYGINYDDFRKTGLNRLNPTMSGADAKTETQAFQGTIDGNGYKISNAKLMYGADMATYDGNAYSGTNFIGCLGGNGVLKNLTIENVSFQTYQEAFGEEKTFDKLNAAGTITATNVLQSGGFSTGMFANIFGTIKDCKITFTGKESLPKASIHGNIFLFGDLYKTGASIENVIIDVSALGNYQDGYKGTYVFRLTESGVKVSNFYIVSSVSNSKDGIYKGDAKPNGYTVLKDEDALKAMVMPKEFVNWMKAEGSAPVLRQNITLG